MHLKLLPHEIPETNKRMCALEIRVPVYLVLFLMSEPHPVHPFPLYYRRIPMLAHESRTKTNIRNLYYWH